MIAELITRNAILKRVPKNEYPKRVYRLLKKHGFNPDTLSYIHVTGSKGKGSIARTCFELLKESGKHVGLFTSPHIFDIRERFETSAGLITEETLLSLYNQYSDIFRKEGLHFFEICLFIAIAYFEKQQCTYIVLEVGVGGRWDPTNFCVPLVSLLGHISLEHKNILGTTLEEIAYDKAGIIKQNIPAFSVPQENTVQKILENEGAITFIHPEFRIKNGLALIPYKNQQLILNRVGSAHVLNFYTALQGVLSFLPDLSIEAIQKTAQKKIPYRMDEIQKNIMIDTAHNGASFKNLLETLKHWLHWSHITLCITILKGKEIQEISSVIIEYKDIIKNIIVFDFDNDKSDGKTLYSFLKKDFVSIDYQEMLTELPSYEKLVFAGSFYSIEKITKLLDLK